MEEELWQKLLQ